MNDPNNLANLGQVDNIFIDKTGTLTKGDFKVSSIFTGKKFFLFKEYSFEEPFTINNLNMITNGKNEKDITKIESNPNLPSSQQIEDGIVNSAQRCSGDKKNSEDDIFLLKNPKDFTITNINNLEDYEGN